MTKKTNLERFCRTVTLTHLAVLIAVVLLVTCSGCASANYGYDRVTRSMIGYGTFTPKHVSYYAKQKRECRQAERRGL